MDDFKLFASDPKAKRWSFLWVGDNEKIEFLGITRNKSRTLFIVRKFYPSEDPNLWICELLEPEIDSSDLFQYLLDYRTKSARL